MSEPREPKAEKRQPATLEEIMADAGSMAAQEMVAGFQSFEAYTQSGNPDALRAARLHFAASGLAIVVIAAGEGSKAEEAMPESGIPNSEAGAWVM